MMRVQPRLSRTTVLTAGSALKLAANAARRPLRRGLCCGGLKGVPLPAWMSGRVPAFSALCISPEVWRRRSLSRESPIATTFRYPGGARSAIHGRRARFAQRREQNDRSFSDRLAVRPGASLLRQARPFPARPLVPPLCQSSARAR